MAAIITVNNRALELLPDGRLADLADWNEDVAQSLAAKEDITLTDEHWEVISLLRIYYAEFHVSPIRKLLKRTITERLGAEKADDSYLAKLFPQNVLIQGTRIAGVPVPMLDAELDQDYYTAKSRSRDRVGLNNIEFEGKIYYTFPSGNLAHAEDWSEALAVHLAKQQDLELTAEHWEVLNFMRGFYFKYGIAPMVKLLKKHLSETLGNDKANNDYLYRLFPNGPARQGSIIAGLPEPQGCIDPE